MKKVLMVMVLISMTLLGAGCQAEKQPAKQQTVLTVSVAASLTDCMETMTEAFNKEYPNVKLQFNFGSSGALQQQIEQGAPVDVFFSAGMKQMNALEEAGLLEEGSAVKALENHLALIVPADSTQTITFSSLADVNLEKLAVGEVESVPAGQYTMEVFDHLGITETLKPQLVYAKDVREVLSWVETGNAQAGVVYETDAKISDKVKIADLADSSLHSPIIYPVGIIKSTENLEDAKLFVEFLKTETAAEIFTDYGFTPIF